MSTTPNHAEEALSIELMDKDSDGSDLAEACLEDYTNVLVQYQGGGYDGCFWEWNYFVLDKAGNFHDIASSGYKGITTKEKALAYLEDDDKDSLYIYKLNDEEQIKEFDRECNAGHVVGCTNKIAELIEAGVDIDALYWFCDECGAKVNDGKATDYSGCGGIAVQANTKLCEDCYYKQYYEDNDDEDDDD